jgi:ribosomal protein S18 acetylase RimI-like enzyme
LRLVTDYATFAYLCDVIIHEDYRGRGLGKWMVGEALQHPDIQPLRRISLMTQDAQSLYAPFGFRHLSDPNRYMEKMKMEA